jgi:hypothetical protein
MNEADRLFLRAAARTGDAADRNERLACEFFSAPAAMTKRMRHDLRRLV